VEKICLGERYLTVEGKEQPHKINPSLIHCSLLHYGQRGGFLIEKAREEDGNENLYITLLHLPYYWWVGWDR
jgi:hypothetical protein